MTLRRIILLAAGLLALAAPAHAAPPETPDSDWVVDGIVHGLARSGTTLYVGGEFERVSPRTGSLVGVGPDGAVARLPEVVGNVSAVVPDGLGGWYLGGSFSSVGGAQRDSLAHVLPGGSVDPFFHPGAVVGGGVNAIARVGDSIFVGGSFDSIGGQGRRGLASLTRATGALEPFDVGVWAYSDSVSELAYVHALGQLLVVGSFACAGVDDHQPGCVGPEEVVRRNALGIVPSSGAISSWNPAPNGSVSSLAVTGTHIYLGGAFDCFGSADDDCTDLTDAPGRGVARLPLGSAQPDGWSAGIGAGVVYDIELSGSSLYAVGEFDCANANGDADCSDPGEVTRHNMLRISTDTGVIAPWNPAPDGRVRAVAVSDGRIWIGGDFNVAGGAARHHLAVLEPLVGGALAQDPAPDDAVTVLVSTGDGGVLAGGWFAGAGGVGRRGFAAIDLLTGTPLPLQLDVEEGGWVNVLSVAGGRLYIGGSFDSLGAQPRRSLAALDLAGGTLTGWSPQLAPGDEVAALAVHDGVAYAGGYFAGDYLTGFGEAGGQPVALPQPSAPVLALAVRGSTLYAGGEFESFGGFERTFAAALALPTGTVTAWNPQADYHVTALAASGDAVYAGGLFTTIGGAPRNALAALDPVTGAAHTGFDAGVSGGPVRALAFLGGDLLAGGAFSALGSGGHGHAALVDAGSGAPRAWDPAVVGDVYAVAAGETSLSLGGDLITVGETSQRGAATFTPPLALLAPPALGSGAALTCDGGHWQGDPALAYAWLRDGLPIASGPAYAPGAADAGHSLACAVTATNRHGSSQALSAALAVPAAPATPPVPPASPPAKPVARKLTLSAHVAPGVKRLGASSYRLRLGTRLRLTGTLTAGGKPVARTTVLLRRTAGKTTRIVARVRTDAKGRFAFVVRPARTLSVRYTAGFGAARSKAVGIRIVKRLK